MTPGKVFILRRILLIGIEEGRFTCKRCTYSDHQSRPTWVGSHRAPSLLLVFLSFFTCSQISSPVVLTQLYMIVGTLWSQAQVESDLEAAAQQLSDAECRMHSQKSSRANCGRLLENVIERQQTGNAVSKR